MPFTLTSSSSDMGHHTLVPCWGTFPPSSLLVGDHSTLSIPRILQRPTSHIATIVDPSLECPRRQWLLALCFYSISSNYFLSASSYISHYSCIVNNTKVQSSKNMLSDGEVFNWSGHLGVEWEVTQEGQQRHRRVLAMGQKVREDSWEYYSSHSSCKSVSVSAGEFLKYMASSWHPLMLTVFPGTWLSSCRTQLYLLKQHGIAW